MKKIQLKITPEQLNVIIKALNEVCTKTDNNFEFKFIQSVILELNQKLSKKSIDKVGTTKAFKVSLKYYYGFPLTFVLESILNGKWEGIYEQNTARIIFNQIHQQL